MWMSFLVQNRFYLHDTLVQIWSSSAACASLSKRGNAICTAAFIQMHWHLITMHTVHFAHYVSSTNTFTFSSDRINALFTYLRNNLTRIPLYITSDSVAGDRSWLCTWGVSVPCGSSVLYTVSSYCCVLTIHCLSIKNTVQTVPKQSFTVFSQENIRSTPTTRKRNMQSSISTHTHERCQRVLIDDCRSNSRELFKAKQQERFQSQYRWYHGTMDFATKDNPELDGTLDDTNNWVAAIPLS